MHIRFSLFSFKLHWATLPIARPSPHLWFHPDLGRMARPLTPQRRGSRAPSGSSHARRLHLDPRRGEGPSRGRAGPGTSARRATHLARSPASALSSRPPGSPVPFPQRRLPPGPGQRLRSLPGRADPDPRARPSLWEPRPSLAPQHTSGCTVAGLLPAEALQLPATNR